jgi:tRNA dimethylallyltransferase
LEDFREKYNLLVVLGPTATGKTSLAVAIADRIKGEIISSDSRQVYQGMDIGTGKDLSEYEIDGKQIPYHLIDIVKAGAEYNVYEYQKDFIKVFSDFEKREAFPVLCGGTGMYIQSVLQGYQLIQVPNNEELRKELEQKDIEELVEILKSYGPLHNKTDIEHRKRLIRAIEIADFTQKHGEKKMEFPEIKPIIFGIHFEPEELRKRITFRLKQRLSEGMVEEVKSLLDKGLDYDKLKYYGLEYKFVSMYLSGELNYNDMYQKLNSAIHQFAKRQRTWFRKMEREGYEINWVDGKLGLDEKLEVVMKLLI